MAALLLSHLVDESAGFFVPGSLESFRTETGLTYAQAGAVLAAAAPGAIAGNACAVLADHRSRRAIAAGGAFGYAAALAAFGLGGSFPILVAASFALGAASTALCDAVEVALVDVAGPDDLGRALGTGYALGAVGDLLGPVVLAASAAAGFGWRTPFVAGAVLLAAYGAWLASLPLPAPIPRPGNGPPLRDLAAAARDRTVLRLALVAMLIGPLDEPFLGFLLAHLQHRGYSPATATLVALTTVAGGLAAVPVARRTALHAPRRVLTATAAVLLASGIGVVVLPGLAARAAAGFVFGIAVAAAWLTLQPLVLTARPGRAGTVKAVVTTVEFAGFGLPIAAGAAADAHGLGAGLAVYLALPVLIGIAARGVGSREQ